jgi:hypothetical protein
MRHPRAALLAAAALLAGCGRPLFAAEMSVPSLRLVSVPETIDPGSAPADVCAGAPCLLGTAEYDVGGEVPFVGEPGVTVDLRLTSFAVRLSPAASLGGLEFVRVVLHRPGSAAPTVVAAYERPPAAPLPAEIVVSGSSSIDLGPYLRDGRIDARLEFGYQLGSPLGTFTVQTEAEFSVDVIAEYDAFL